MDTDDTIDDVDEQPEAHSLMPDPYVTAFSLIAMAANPRVFKARVREFRQAETAAASRIAEADAREAAFAAYEKATRAELAARETKLREREVNVHIGEERNKERAEAINAEKQRWAALRLPGEPSEMAGTISRGRPFSGYEVATHYAETGRLPMHPDAEPDESSAVVNYDPSGTEFPKHTTITRTPEPPAGVRVRGRRSTDRQATP